MSWKLPWSPTGIPTALDPQAVQDNFKAVEQAIGGLGGSQAALTTLPAASAALEGREVTYLADAANGVIWTFKCRHAGNASGYKWEFKGGSPLASEVTPNENVTSTSYANLGTVGPSITLPLPGDYLVEIGAALTTTANGHIAYMSYAIGGTAASDADSIYNYVYQSGAPQPINVAIHSARPRRKTGLGAVTLTAKYRATGGAVYAADRWMKVTPVRVSA